MHKPKIFFSLHPNLQLNFENIYDRDEIEQNNYKKLSEPNEKT